MCRTRAISSTTTPDPDHAGQGKSSMEPIQGLGDRVLVQICLDRRRCRHLCRALFRPTSVLPIPEVHVTDGFSETEATYFGEPTEAKARIYHWHFGNVGFELLQPLGPKSVWQDWLDEHGPSVHHIAFRVTGQPWRRARVRPPRLSGEPSRASIPAGCRMAGIPASYTYLDTDDGAQNHASSTAQDRSIRMGRSADERARAPARDALPGRLRRARRRRDREEICRRPSASPSRRSSRPPASTRPARR